MDWNNTRYIERIRAWKNLRDEIVMLPFHEALDLVAEFWGTVPLHTSKTVRIYEPETWNTPWEILHENSLCENKVGIMIYHTLVAAYADDDVDVTMRIAHDGKEEFLVVDIDRTYLSDEKYTLNYYNGKAVKNDGKLSINFIHTFDEELPHLRIK